MKTFNNQIAELGKVSALTLGCGGHKWEGGFRIRGIWPLIG
ncbi:MAG: hypothetical protein WCS92_05160 [Candidatus Babeliales bacterium]|jgi:hypothetical protein